MSAASAAAPDELDAYVVAARQLSERERASLRRLERALDAVGPARVQLGPAAQSSPPAIRSVIVQGDAISRHVSAVADSFRAADVVLARLTGTGTAMGSPARSDGESILPPADVEAEWSWPPEWTFEADWGDRRAHADLEVGAGVRAEAGAGLSVTREAIRAGTYAEGRIGAWAIAGVGGALGPFAATARGEAFVGARTRGEALLHIGRDGARAHLGGEAFAGAKAELDLRGGVGPIEAGAHGAVSYGIGGTADADVDLSMKRVGGRVELGATLGLGWEGGFEYYVEPAWIAEGIARVGDDAFEVGSRVVDGSVDAAEEVLGTTMAFAGGAASAGGSVLRSFGGMFD